MIILEESLIQVISTRIWNFSPIVTGRKQRMCWSVMIKDLRLSLIRSKELFNILVGYLLYFAG